MGIDEREFRNIFQ